MHEAGAAGTVEHASQSNGVWKKDLRRTNVDDDASAPAAKANNRGAPGNRCTTEHSEYNSTEEAGQASF